MIRILGTVFAGLVGLAFGSFLNVCLTRWPAGESVVMPRSHCRSCGRTLAWWENVPLVSWVALRGHCRTCGAWIGWRYLVVEVAIAALWATVVWQFLGLALSPDLPAISPFPHHNVYNSLCVAIGQLIFYWLLVALAMLDCEHLWVPDWITRPGSVLGFLFSLLSATVVSSDAPSLPIWYRMGWAAGVCLLAIFAAAGLIFLIRWIYWLVRRREGIGLGDAKLMAMLAAWLGLPGALLAFAIGILLGAIVGVAILLAPRLRPTSDTLALTKLPLGTFLCIGGIVSALWGTQIIGAYMRWSGLL